MSDVSAITNSTAAAQNATDAIASAATKSLSQQDFLKLLVAQMTSQDPLKPIDNQDMLSQMVQFSTLQTNTTFQASLAGLQDSQRFLQATSLLGKEVSIQVDASTMTEGVVAGVDTSTGTPLIVVNGFAYGLDQVLAVTTPSTGSANP